MNSSHRREAEVADLARLLPGPAERDLPTGRRHLIKEHLMTEFRAGYMAAPSPARRRRRPAGRTLALAIGAGALTVTVAATALAGYLSPAASGPGHPGPALSGPITAATLLSKIADAADRAQTPTVRDRQFEYIASMVAFSSSTATVNHGRLVIGKTTLEKLHKRQVWLSVSDLCRPGLLKEQGQDTVLVTKTGCPDRGYLNDPTYRFLQSLPTDPRTLLKLINGQEKGHGITPSQEAFTTIGDLLRESLEPPAVSAALYRAAALIPGVTVVQHATDAIGRRGIAVALAFRGTTTEWIFDRKTLLWLGEREFDTKTGAITGTTATLDRAFVNHAGQLPR